MRALYLAPLLLSTLYGAADLSATLTLAADGITLSGPVANCSSPLSPGSGVTGFSVLDTQDGHTRTPVVLSVTTSGCNLTAVLDEAENNEDTVVFSLSSMSNLTDAMGNTAMGQTNASITNNSEWHAAGNTSYWAPRARMQGGIPAFPSGLYPQTMQCNSADCYFEFSDIDATAIDVSAFDFSSRYILQNSGTDLHDWGVSAATTTWSQRGIVSVSPSVGLYRIIQVNSIGVPFQDQAIRSIRVTTTGATGQVVSARTIIAESGDSTVVPGGVDATTDDRYAHLWNSTEALGRSVEQHPGISGEQVCGGLENDANRFSTLGGTALIGYMRGGGNDVAAGKTAGQLRTCWDNWLANVQALSAPPTHIIAMGIMTCCVSGNIDYSTFNAQISASCAASSGHPSDCTYVDPTLWLAFNAQRQSDGLHLNFPAGSSPCTSLTTGEDTFCNRYKPISAGRVLGSSYTLTGPTSGVAGAPSDSFIITLQAGAVFTVDSDAVGRQSITCNDGGQGGTITPSVGSPGVSPVTITQTSGPTVSFKYTPVSTGAIVIGCAATQSGWRNPASLSYSSVSSAKSGPGSAFGLAIQPGRN